MNGSTTLAKLLTGALVAGLSVAPACIGGKKETAAPQTPPPEPVAQPQPQPPPEPGPPKPEPKPEPVPVLEDVPALAFPEEDFRKAQPNAGKPRKLDLPKLKRFRLPNGIAVYLMEKHDLPVVSIDLTFAGGSMNDPSGKEGLASICMALLTDGTKKLDKIAYNEALADIASSINSSAGSERQSISMRTLSKHFDATFALFADTVVEPGLREKDFSRKIRRSLARLRQVRGSASSVARRLADNLLYGPAHPFGRVYTRKSLEAMTLADCNKYHAAYIKPRGAQLFVMGDVTKAQLRKAFAGSKLKTWRGRPKRSVRLGRPKPRPGKIFFVNIPGSAQSAITIKHFGPKRKARDYFANTFAAAILGGSFSSRVNMNLREDKGYSYGARADFSYSQRYGELGAGTSVRSDATYQSVLELHGEIMAMKKGTRKATTEELERERNGVILGLPARFASARRALGQYRNLVYHRLPLNYYNTYISKVRRVRLAQVNRSAKRHFKPNRAVYLIVGDANAIQQKYVPGKPGEKGQDVPLLDDKGKPMTLLASLRRLVANGVLGKGELVILDADGNVVKD